MTPARPKAPRRLFGAVIGVLVGTVVLLALYAYSDDPSRAVLFSNGDVITMTGGVAHVADV